MKSDKIDLIGYHQFSDEPCVETPSNNFEKKSFEFPGDLILKDF